MLPAAATFWMPRRDELDEEGIGYFRDTWTILDVPVRLARDLVRQERQIASTVGALAVDDQHFDALALAVERGRCPASSDVNRIRPEHRTLLDDLIVDDDDYAPLEGLEIGVAGLVYALATVRIIPAASCRGHSGTNTWSDRPVVLFASTRFRAMALQPLVQRTGCRFGIDEARPDLLAVSGSSILDTMALAEGVLDSRSTFVQRRTRPPTRRGKPSSSQGQLF